MNKFKRCLNKTPWLVCWFNHAVYKCLWYKFSKPVIFTGSVILIGASFALVGAWVLEKLGTLSFGVSVLLLVICTLIDWTRYDPCNEEVDTICVEQLELLAIVLSTKGYKFIAMSGYNSGDNWTEIRQ